MLFITANQLAALGNLSQRAIQRACACIQNGQTSLWRGAELEIRVAHGRGGRSGILYEVKVGSLPVDLQERFKALSTVDKQALNPVLTDKAKFERNWWLNLLQPVLQHPERSPERTDAINDICERTHIDWNAHTRSVSKRTVYAKIAAYQKHGIAGLARRSRVDKGAKRVILSFVWDRAVPFDDATKQEIADNVKKQIRGLLAERSTTGTVKRSTSKFLKVATINAGRDNNYFPDEAELRRICKIPNALIKAESKFRGIAQYKYDKKAYADSGPRIARIWKDMAPMEVVVADVHHTNVLLQKEDGRTGTPKMIAWMDMATRRVWVDLIFFEKRGGVRNMDAISSFARMAQNAAYGVPQVLYADNGSEYNFTSLIDDALKLNVQVQPLRVPAQEGNSQVRHARPYNAPAKPIEAWFGLFEQNYLKHVPGYIGDDRMNTPTRQLGKRPTPFEGSFEEFCDVFYKLLDAYHANHETGGQYGDQTPNEMFQQHVENGWKATVMRELDLHYVLCVRETRKVTNHSVKVAGRVWTCDELDAYHGDTVFVRIPKWCAGFNALILETDKGEQLGIARPQELTHPLDERQAKHSAHRNATRNKSMRAMAKTVPEINVAAEIIEAASDRPSVTPNEPDAVITAGLQPVHGLVEIASSEPRDFEEARERKREAKIEEENRNFSNLMSRIGEKARRV